VLAGVVPGAEVPVVAHRAVRLGGVGRAGGARAGTHLGRVARAGRRPALDAARLEGVERTGGARPVAGLLEVAGARRRAADRSAAGRIGRVDAAAAGIAGVGGADGAVVGARRAARGRRAAAPPHVAAVRHGAVAAVVAGGPVNHRRARARPALAGVG